jgi:hypothetical protein
MAGEQCGRTDTTVVRLSGVGDRRICPDHIATLERLGMHFRRLDDTVPQPAWRQRLTARDQTGLALSGEPL